MTEIPEGRSFWQRLFGRSKVSPFSPRQERALRYVIRRIDDGAPLQEALQEEYVRRNCSQMEVNQIAGSPEVVEAARRQMRESLDSRELRP